MLQTSRFSLILTFSESGISAFINVMQDSENNVSWVTKQSCKNIKISGWECAITQMNLANRRSAFSDLELATRDFCQFQPSECSSQLKKKPSESPEEASFTLSRKTVGIQVMQDRNGASMCEDCKCLQERSHSDFFCLVFVKFFHQLRRKHKYRAIPLPLSTLCTTQMYFFLQEASFVGNEGWE